jgi:hypothetical protein
VKPKRQRDERAEIGKASYRPDIDAHRVGT